jgi:hypothetical protein
MAKPTGVARRLLVLQEWAREQGEGRSQKEMAEEIGISQSLWNHVLTMPNRDLSKDIAFKIHARWPDISLEWLWLGEKDYLTVKTARALDEIERRLS